MWKRRRRTKWEAIAVAEAEKSACTRQLGVALEESGQLERHFVGGFDNTELC